MYVCIYMYIYICIYIYMLYKKQQQNKRRWMTVGSTENENRRLYLLTFRSRYPKVSKFLNFFRMHP